MIRKGMKRALTQIWCCCVFAGATGLVRGETIEAHMPNGLTASAEYHQGEASKPAVLIVHGFLATRNFRTVFNLGNDLADDHFSVLSPTLTLGVNRRQISLACEAIHTHTMDQDIAEVNFWVQWLTEKGHTRIALVGHSFGSLVSLLYATKYHNPAVKMLIATSLVDVEQGIEEDLAAEQLRLANERLARRSEELAEYRLSFCQKYIAPPKSYLSYAKWSKQQILHALKEAKVPVKVILGRADSRMGADWSEILEKSGVQTVMVSGANHFFDAQHQFDLVDNVLASLNTL